MESDLKQRIVTAGALLTLFLSLLVFAFYSDVGKILLASVGTTLSIIVACELSNLLKPEIEINKIKSGATAGGEDGFSSSKADSFSEGWFKVAGLMVLAVTTPLLVVVKGVSWQADVSGPLTPMILGSTVLAGVLFSTLFLLTLLIACTTRDGVAAQSSSGDFARTFPSLDRSYLLVMIGALAYGGMGFGALAMFAFFPSFLLWLVALAVIADSAAYFFGRKVGGTRLLPQVSPGKTVAGAVAGLAASTIFGIAVTHTTLFHSVGMVFLDNFGRWYGVLMVAVVVAFGTAGDLGKSVLKRLAKVKDSGSIFPGHGGVLDRFDSLLFCAIALLAVWAATGFVPSSH